MRKIGIGFTIMVVAALYLNFGYFFADFNHQAAKNPQGSLANQIVTVDGALAYRQDTLEEFSASEQEEVNFLNVARGIFSIFWPVYSVIIAIGWLIKFLVWLFWLIFFGGLAHYLGWV